MRTFEAALLTANLAALIAGFGVRFQAFRPSLAFLCLLTLGVHGLVEGFRWQLAFSYAFTLLLAASALARARRRGPEHGLPSGLRVAVAGLSLALLALTSILAIAFPVFTLPALTGPYPVGVRYVHLIDERRPDPFIQGSDRRRELMVKIYYPAKEDAAKPPSRYFRGSPRLLKSMAAFYQLPGFALDHLRLVTTHSRDGLELSPAQAKYPVVLFSHGAGASMEVQTSQSEDLASHGYVVAAVDHTFVSAATDFPDRLVTAREATTDFNTPEPAEPITRIMADDDRFVLRRLGELNAGRIASQFNGRLDLDRVGVLGHSVGGAVAYQLALEDPRVKAAVNLDGVVYVTPRSPDEIAPFLMLANDRDHVQSIQARESLAKRQQMADARGNPGSHDARIDRAQQCVAGLAAVLKRSGNLYSIRGSDHMKFTDIGLFIGARWLRELLQIRGQTSPRRCLQITQALTATFFDEHLKRPGAGGRAGLQRSYPELRQVGVD